MPLTTQDVAVCAAVAALAYAVRVYSKKSSLPYPPGPQGYPLIGNLGFPEDPALWKKVRAMSEEYGSDVIRFPMAGTSIIFLNSWEASTELMDKRSLIYSDRPVDGMVMLRELVGMEWTFGLQKYGSEWRDGRKAFHHEFRPQVVHKFRPIETRGVHYLLRSLLKTPEDFMRHCQHLSGRVIMEVAYGIEVQEKNDPWIATAEHALEGATVTGIPGSFMVDIIPILKYVPEWVPGASFQKIARAYRESALSILHKPFELVKNQMAQGDPNELPPSAAKSLIEGMINTADDAGYTERVVKSALGSMYTAGSDTVGGALQIFILAMVLHPEVQRKAQGSIDSVCQGRLPDFSDYDHLPYVHAAIRESLRWCPVVMLNLAHQLMQDDEYKGYHIPAGSIVIVNNWSVLHDPEAYPNPEQFNPDRFLTTGPDGNLQLDPSVRDPEVGGAFGWGRRICPGRHMAYDTFWLAVATMLATFEISKAKDGEGNYVLPDPEPVGGLINHIKPFICNIKVRSAEHEELILATET